jgi:hypothetical protein
MIGLINDLRNAIFYFGSIVVAIVCFIIAVAYIFLTISVNAGRISDLTIIDSHIQASATELTQQRSDKDVEAIRNAIRDNTGRRDGQLKTIAFGDERFFTKTFKECALAFDADCFHRNSSFMNNIYLGIACGILGVCLAFFFSIRADALTEKSAMWTLSTLISLICLLPIGASIGLLTLFILRGANGGILSQVSGVVQVESPFGIAFACTLAALFCDRILAALSRLLDNFGGSLASTTKV